MTKNQRIHVNNSLFRHFTIGEVPCPRCKTVKAAPCLDIDNLSRYYLPHNTVHTARLRKMGYNVL